MALHLDRIAARLLSAYPQDEVEAPVCVGQRFDEGTISSGDPFDEEPVPLEVFLHDDRYLHLPYLSEIQMETVRRATNVLPQWINDLIGVPKSTEDVLVCLWGKGCIAGSSIMIDPVTGESRTVKEWADLGLIPNLWTWNKALKKLEVEQALCVPFVKGHGRMLDVTTHKGRVVRVHESHKVAVSRNPKSGNPPSRQRWREEHLQFVEAKELRVGDLVIQLDEVPLTRSRGLEGELRLFGMLLGDGCYSKTVGRSLNFVTSEIEMADLFESLFHCAVPETGLWRGSRMDGCRTKPLYSLQARRTPQLAAFKNKYGLWDKTAYTKDIPDWVLGCSRFELIALVEGLWSTDGSIFKCKVSGNRHHPGWKCEYDTSSGRLARSLQHILGMLGIQSNVSQRKVGDYSGWRVTLNSERGLSEFRNVIHVWNKPIGDFPQFPVRQEFTWVESVAEAGDEDYYDIQMPGNHNYVSEGFLHHNSGKDFVTRISIIRVIYLLMCLKAPQAVYGKSSTDSIDTINMAWNAYQAQQVFFAPLVRLLGACPWFENRFDPILRRVAFEKNLFIHSGNSANESFEGFNPIMVVLDEIDAFRTAEDLSHTGSWNPEHSAEGVFKSLKSSVQSRYPGLGKIMLISFLRRPEGFMMQQVKAGLHDSSTYVSVAPTWEANPSRERSDFDKEFERDPDDSLQRYACQPRPTSGHFFRNRAALYSTFYYDDVRDELLAGAPVNPFVDGAFLESYHVAEVDTRTRYMHVDIGVTNDSAGICAVHVDHWREVEGHRLPVVAVDFYANLDPHEIGEIQISSIRDVIRKFRARRESGVNMGMVSFDQFNSTDSMQILAAEGIPTGRMSVDRDESAYGILKDLIYDSRLISPGSELAAKQLRGLIYDRRGKVDHPVAGYGKDLSDALAGAVADLYNDLYTEDGYEDLMDKDAIERAMAAVEIVATGTYVPNPTLQEVASW